MTGATKGILRSGWLAIRSFEIPGVRLRLGAKDGAEGGI